ncbi:ClpXP protease specificity-enhancing factor SspB [Roseomonas sp. E05]|uniref:SspB family protein n=1 Tax=Roseomonas sp. E05 TaxID=3046310 RepID=UPI0024B945BD|nr:ClpXP protease specificity-enhancing factor SspB [Roseomonas sp. E05]MDJ0387425.1 ClpXP protease specificity-enhancing factor SspB [Roseomonas sp. E05]
MTEDNKQAESLLPYDRWTEEAMREVALKALEHVGVHGLPGEHHFYLTFRTDHPGVAMPNHLKARYPEEMTIVLQHQFWDLKVDRDAGFVTAGLSFGGMPATLTIPISALTAFWDPHVRVGLRFPSAEAAAKPAEEALPAEDAAPAPMAEQGEDGEPKPAAEEGPAQVVSLDAFRRRPTRD